MSYAKSILSGVSWSGLQIIFDRVLGFLVKLVLARILFPEDFGIIGMAAVFIAILQTFRDVGMGASLIQKKDVTQTEFSTAFWTTLGWSVLLYSMLFFSTPLIADFYGQEILVPVIRVLGISILTGPINLVQRIRMNRNLQFKKLAFINNMSNLISSVVAVIGALYGLGVWALVIQSTGPFVVRIPFFYFMGSWKPTREFSKRAFKEIFSFGAYTTGTDVLSRVVAQADFLLVGKFLGAYELGLYSFAFLMTSTLRGQLITVINKVMFPVFSKMQDDHKKLKQYYMQVIEINTLIIYPLFTMLILFSHDIVGLLFPRWLDSVPLINILTIGVFIGALSNSFRSFIRGVGKPEWELQIQLVKALFFVAAIFAGYWLLGIEGVAWAVNATAVLNTVMILRLLYKRFQLTLGHLWTAIRLPFLTMLAITVVVMLSRMVTDWVIVQMLAGILTAAVLYWSTLNKYYHLVLALKKK